MPSSAMSSDGLPVPASNCDVATRSLPPRPAERKQRRHVRASDARIARNTASTAPAFWTAACRRGNSVAASAPPISTLPATVPPRSANASRNAADGTAHAVVRAGRCTSTRLRVARQHVFARRRCRRLPATARNSHCRPAAARSRGSARASARPQPAHRRTPRPLHRDRAGRRTKSLPSDAACAYAATAPPAVPAVS